MSEPPSYPQIADATLRAFREIHDRVFRGDPAENPRLSVQLIGGRLVADTPALVLLTPWTCNGLAFPPDGQFPDRVQVAGRPMAARPVSVPGLGRLFSANLVADVSMIGSQEAAVARATGWVEPWLAAVAAARDGAPRPDGDAPREGTTPTAGVAAAPDPSSPERELSRRGLFTLGRE